MHGVRYLTCHAAALRWLLSQSAETHVLEGIKSRLSTRGLTEREAAEQRAQRHQQQAHNQQAGQHAQLRAVVDVPGEANHRQTGRDALVPRILLQGQGTCWCGAGSIMS